MLKLYFFCLVIGGIFVGLAALAGLDGVDFDSDFDPDVALNDPSSASKSRSIFHRSRRRWQVLFSLRFWTFGGCFFGLTGVLLSWLTPSLSAHWIVTLSLLVGICCGGVMVWILSQLRQQQADSLVRCDDLLGLTGVVQLPFDAQSLGKIRVAVKGTSVDLMALTSDDSSFKLGDQVVVVGREQNKVWVVSQQTFSKITD